MYSKFRKVAPISMTHTVPICFAHKKLRKPPQKVVYLWQLEVFFSAAPPAQNSAELHFRFINLSIQPSLLGSPSTMHFCHVFDRFIIIVAYHWQFFSGCYIFATCGSTAALAEIWTITIMAYERSRIICSPSSKVRLSGIQVSLLCASEMIMPA